MTDNKEQQECKVCGKTLTPHDITYGYHQCIIEQPKVSVEGQQEKQGESRYTVSELLNIIVERGKRIQELESELSAAKQDREHLAKLASERFSECVDHLETIETLQQRIAELESSQVKDIEDAWDAAEQKTTYDLASRIDMDYIRTHFGDNPPPDKASYLKQFTGK